MVVAGEARSANRTKWTRHDAEQHALDNGSTAQQHLGITMNPLQDVDAVHELVNSVNC